MEPKKRPHRATGRKRTRPPNSGMKKGGHKSIPDGTIRALAALRMRVPEKMTDDVRELLHESEQAIIDVMNGKVHPSIASAKLKAATTVREEVVGPIVQKVDTTMRAQIGIATLLDEVKVLERAEATKALPPPEEPTGV